MPRPRFPRQLFYWARRERSSFAHIEFHCVQAFMENPLGHGGQRSLGTPGERMNTANVSRATRVTRGVCPACLQRYRSAKWVRRESRKGRVGS